MSTPPNPNDDDNRWLVALLFASARAEPECLILSPLLMVLYFIVRIGYITVMYLRNIFLGKE